MAFNKFESKPSTTLNKNFKANPDKDNLLYHGKDAYKNYIDIKNANLRISQIPFPIDNISTKTKTNHVNCPGMFYDHESLIIPISLIQYKNSNDTNLNYKHSNRRFFINKNFRIEMRPFPVRSIYVDADFSGFGQLQLSFLTNLGESLIKNAVRNIKWGRDHTFNNEGRFCWYFDLTQHARKDIEFLLEDIFNQLTILTSDSAVLNRLLFIKKMASRMLETYFLSYKKELLPLIGFTTNEKRDYSNNMLMEGRELLNAIFFLDMEKVIHLLERGKKSNAYHCGMTALSAAVDIESYKHLKKDRESQSKMHNIINLLIDREADPMLISFGNTVVEHLVINCHKAVHIPAEFYEEAIRRLIAAPSYRPHIAGLGLTLDGRNMFFKPPIINNDKYPDIISLTRDDNSLCFHAYNYRISSYQKIIVEIKSVRDFIGFDKTTTTMKDELFNLFKRNCPLGNFKSEDEARNYFEKILISPSGIVDVVYVDNELSGMAISAKMDVIHDNKEHSIYYPKLGVANKILGDYKGLMLNLIFARGIAQQADNPDVPVFAFYEAASRASYLKTKHFAHPTVQNTKSHTLINQIAKALYEEDKSKISSDKLYAEDPLALATFSPEPEAWNIKDIYASVYEKHYQKNNYAMLMGFFITPDNLEKLEKAIRLPGSKIQLMDIAKLLMRDFMENPLIRSKY